MTAFDLLKNAARCSIFDVCEKELPGLDYALDNDGDIDLCIIMLGTNDLARVY